MIIDMDSHLREGYFLDEVYKLDGPLARFTPKKAGDGRSHATRFIHSLEPGDAAALRAFKHPYIYDPKNDPELADRQRGGYDVARRRADARREGIDRQVIFPTGIDIATKNEGELGAALARCYNDWVGNLVKGNEDVFMPCAAAPAGCPERMAVELRRCVKEKGFKAGHLVCYCGPRNLDDPSFHDYFAAAQELDVPLLCHPNSVGELTDRFDNFFKLHIAGRHNNCTTALIALVAGGVFEKFPKLRIAFFECSTEWMLYWMHRMDDDWEWAADYAEETGGAALRMAPSEYIKRNCYVSCEADERYLGNAVAELGADHICMATDYPHFDSKFPETVSSIRQRPDLTAQQKEMILGGTAAALLRL